MPEVIFSLVAMVAVSFYIREYSLRKKIQSDSKPKAEDGTNFSTIAQLTDKSRQIVTQAEKDAGKLVQEAHDLNAKTTQDFSQSLNTFLEEEKKQTEQAESQIISEFKTEEEKFDQFLKDLQKVLDNKTENAANNFNAYLEALKQEAQKSQAANWEGAKTRVAQLFENFETKLADFLLATEQKMMLSVDLELKSARSLIDTYKVQQMNIIDENIVAMLEKTLSLVLAKNLNLKDQMELVYESLEKAKTESFLV